MICIAPAKSRALWPPTDGATGGACDGESDGALMVLLPVFDAPYAVHSPPSTHRRALVLRSELTARFSRARSA